MTISDLLQFSSCGNSYKFVWQSPSFQRQLAPEMDENQHSLQGCRETHKHFYVNANKSFIESMINPNIVWINMFKWCSRLQRQQQCLHMKDKFNSRVYPRLHIKTCFYTIKKDLCTSKWHATYYVFCLYKKVYTCSREKLFLPTVIQNFLNRFCKQFIEYSSQKSNL